MSAPRTDVEKQKKNHRFSLAGIAVVLCFVALILAGLMYVTANRGNTPGEAQRLDAPANTQTGVTSGAEVGMKPADAPATTEVAPTADPVNTPDGATPANN